MDISSVISKRNYCNDLSCQVSYQTTYQATWHASISKRITNIISRPKINISRDHIKRHIKNEFLKPAFQAHFKQYPIWFYLKFSISLCNPAIVILFLYSLCIYNKPSPSLPRPCSPPPLSSRTQPCCCAFPAPSPLPRPGSPPPSSSCTSAPCPCSPPPLSSDSEKSSEP